jgi:hypothetical protein
VEHAKRLLDNIEQYNIVRKSEDPEYSVVVAWPDIVIRYVLLQNENRETFDAFLRQLQLQRPLVRSEIPYRDKKIPLAAMRFSGDFEDVLYVKENVVGILDEYKGRVCQVSLLVNRVQIDILRAENFRIIKSIQRRFGVFINTLDENARTIRKNHIGGIDMRLTARGEVIQEDVAVI